MGDERLEEHLVVAHLVQDGEGGGGNRQAVIPQLPHQEFHPIDCDRRGTHSGQDSQPPGQISSCALCLKLIGTPKI